MATKVQGHCDPRFAEVEQHFQSFLDSGSELGASFFATLDGRPIIDLWGGHADAARTLPWTRDTIANIWSTTKCVSALAGLVLISRGLVAANDKVSKHWPEFAANGKADVEIRHLLGHTSGVSGWAAPVSVAEVADPAVSTPRLAAQPAWWVPGEGSGYHGLTYGHLIGEVVRRVTGKTLGEFIASELAGPLGADFRLGVADADLPRTAEIIPPPPYVDEPHPFADLPPDSAAAKSLLNPKMTAATANTDEWRKGEIGAGNGHSNARGVARILSPVSLGGTANGVQILTPETIDLIFEEQAKGVDLVVGQKMRMGIGFGLPWKESIAEWLPGEGRICYWGGWGGSVGLMDVDRRLTVGYVMNKMENGPFGNERVKAYVGALYKALGVEV